jgi:hypothetical protein
MSNMDSIIGAVAASGALDRAKASAGKATATARKKAEKAKRRSQRKAQEQSAAVSADNWDDRDGKARPTPERRAKGDWELRDGEDAGVTVAVDRRASMLDQLGHIGKITANQVQGGHDFAALMQRMQMVPAGRSCLDFSPVGFDAADEPTHAELRDAQDRTELYLACGMLTWAELRRVCVDGDAPRSYDRLRAGLDLCVKFWAT